MALEIPKVWNFGFWKSAKGSSGRCTYTPKHVPICSFELLLFIFSSSPHYILFLFISWVHHFIIFIIFHLHLHLSFWSSFLSVHLHCLSLFPFISIYFHSSLFVFTLFAFICIWEKETLLKWTQLYSSSESAKSCIRVYVHPKAPK